MAHRSLIVALSFAAVCSMRIAAAPDIVTVDGGQISGVSDNGVRAFKGIPFAAPPVGDLRWKAPQPVAAWSGVKAADKFGNQCIQVPYPESSLFLRVTAAVE
jgi:para-nitrobenzyl esterase